MHGHIRDDGVRRVWAWFCAPPNMSRSQRTAFIEERKRLARVLGEVAKSAIKIAERQLQRIYR